VLKEQLVRSREGTIVNQFLLANETQLSLLYKSLLAPGTQRLSVQLALKFLETSKAAKLSGADARWVLAHSKLPFIDEKQQGFRANQYFQVGFEEFQEILARVSIIKFKEAGEERWPLSYKVQSLASALIDERNIKVEVAQVV
jgi:hypothetical protein